MSGIEAAELAIHPTRGERPYASVFSLPFSSCRSSVDNLITDQIQAVTRVGKPVKCG